MGANSIFIHAVSGASAFQKSAFAVAKIKLPHADERHIKSQPHNLIDIEQKALTPVV
jgi:hypothetical protein